MRSLPLLLPPLLLLVACSQNPHVDVASTRAVKSASSQNAVSNETPASPGRPDSDGDGVPDDEDQCIHVPGLASNHGCPVETDEPAVPAPTKIDGPASWAGMPDRDGDGTPDDFDKCKDLPGPIFNDGCPVHASEHVIVPESTSACPYAGAEEEERTVIEEVRESLKFDFDRARIKEQSYPGLHLLEQFLRKYPRSHLYMIGNTDDQGTEGYNLELSRARVYAVKQFLVNQGINGRRISVDARGEDDPMVDVTGLRGTSLDRARAENRRVDLFVRYESVERVR